jgi:ABC-type branched-subunit amino acid transport system substrate-binding protein
LKLQKSFLTCLILIIGIVTAKAQFDERQMFAKGIEFYKQQQYRDAQKTFFTALKNFPNSTIQTALKLMLAKSYYKMGEYSSSMLVVEDFINRYPQSDYLDDIYYLRGEIDFRQEKYYQAVEDWQWVINRGEDPRLKNKAGTYVFHTVDQYLDDREIASLDKKYNDDVFNGLLEIIRDKKMIDSDQAEQGEIRLRRFLDKNPYHFYADIASEILRKGRGSSVSSNTIVLLKSDQEGQKKVTDALARGFYYAAYEMAQRDLQKAVKIDTVVVETDVLSMLKTSLDVINQRQPLAVVGPLDDDENTTLALLSKYEYFPFISPFSSQDGLAAVSPYTFQINPDAEIKGRFLAQYALEELGAKTFATLTPADAYGISLEKGFEDVLKEHNAELVEKQWYYEDTQDFSRQLKAIRNKGFYVAFRDSVMGSDSTLTDEQIEEQFQQYLTETLFSSEGRREIDSTQVASTGIDALFIAVYPEYVPYIAPQFAFQNIKTQLLGNEGWNDPEMLMQQRVYLDGLIYISAGYFDPESWNYKAFLSRFRQQMQVTPQIYHLLGYDIGKWMISHYRPGISRGEYRDGLADGDSYQGILENIKFGIKPRVNSQLNIIKFYRGQILKIK